MLLNLFTAYLSMFHFKGVRLIRILHALDLHCLLPALNCCGQTLVLVACGDFDRCLWLQSCCLRFALGLPFGSRFALRAAAAASELYVWECDVFVLTLFHFV